MGEGVNPTQMCQTLVNKVAQSKQLSAVTDPDLLMLFNDWLEELEAEVPAHVNSRGPINEKTLARELGLSLRGATFLLSKLNRERRLKNCSPRALWGVPAGRGAPPCKRRHVFWFQAHLHTHG